MGADHVETGICQRFLSDLEGVDGRVVLGNEELLTRFNLAQRLLWVHTAEPVLLQFLGDILYCQEIHWRCV